MDEFDKFKKIVERFGWTGGIAVAGATFAPLVTAAAGVATPWPDGLPFFTSVFMLLALMSAFLFAGTRKRRSFARSFVVLVALFVLLFGGYLYSFDRFVRPVPGAAPVILGCTYTPDIRLVVRASGKETGSECPGPAAQMLEGAGYEPVGMWTEESIGGIKFLLLGLWLAMFSALAGVLGVFLVRTSRKVRGTAAAAPAADPAPSAED